jgi:hypothetical protein
MERFQTVNNSSEDAHVIGAFEPHPVAISAFDFNSGVPVEAASSNSPGLGPCLYLGSKGERCGQPALRDGFCAKHQPGADKPMRRTLPRVVGAGIGILAAAWPLLADVLREIIRWIHSH